MELLRRGIHSLESNSQLRDWISEEEDVAKAIDNIVKQREEATKYLGKYGVAQKADLKDMMLKIQEQNPPHMNAYRELAKANRNYVASLKAVLTKAERVQELEKKFKDCEEKVKKKKATDSELQNIKKDKEAAEIEFDKFQDTTLRDAFKLVTQEYMKFYASGMQVMQTQLGIVGGAPAHGAPPQGMPPQGMPPQGMPPQGMPPQGYPPQGYPQGMPPPSYQGGAPPQGYGYPPQGMPPQGYPPQGMPPQGYPPQGMPPPGQGMPPQGQGMPPQGQGMPPPGQGMPPPGQGMPPPGQGMPPPGQGVPPQGQGMPPPGQGAPALPPHDQGVPPQGQGMPPPPG